MACYQKKGKIYKLYRPGIENVYIGSSFISLNQEMKKHYNDYKLYTYGKRCYRSSYDLVKYDDCKIILLEECYCNNREELKNREEVYKNKYGKNCINLYYYYHLDNYYVIMKYLKLYYYGNRYTSLKNNREHYQNLKNKNKNKKHIKSNLSRLLEKERNKQYYIDNREKLLERYKQYYKDRKIRTINK